MHFKYEIYLHMPREYVSYMTQGFSVSASYCLFVSSIKYHKVPDSDAFI